MKFKLVTLSFLSFFLFAFPAEAGKITNWNFDRSQNRLTFTTDEGVQPKAQLISNPTRLIVDLPGTTLGQPTINRPIGGTITSVRIGQFDAQTTRLVIELAPGYTIDPNQIKIQGNNPQQWSIELPTPERINLLPNTLPPSQPSSEPTISRNPTSSNSSDSPFFQVTDQGLVVKIGDQEPQRITVRRNGDGQQIDFFLDGITLDSTLKDKSFAVNRYGVNTVAFFQSSSQREPWSRITLKVERDSPNWQATYSRDGAVILLPEGGLGKFNQGNTNDPNPNATKPIPRGQQTLLQSVEWSNNRSQLLIKTEGEANSTSNWNRESGIYEIRISNAKIAEQFRGPELQPTDPIAVMRIIEEESDIVSILLQPASGANIQALNQPTGELLALEFKRAGTPLPELTTIPVPPPENNSTPPTTSTPRVVNNNRQGRSLVVIDPGHGGKDPGTIGIGGIQEKNIILPISQHLQQFLTDNGVQVLMVRDTDYFVSLEGRTELANRAGADLFVSIHANAISLSRPDVNGLETYHYGSGAGLANSIHRNILQRIKIKDRGVRTSRFFVLRNSKMPSVLVEVGFLTGREDVANLTNPDYRRRMAEAIGYGILEYINKKN